MEYGAERNVILATPTTLIALLRTAAVAWRQERLTVSAAEIAKLAKELYDRIRKLGEHFINIGDGLGKAVKAYNDGIGSIESRLLVTARKLNDQGVFASEEIAALSPVEITPRAIVAPELLPPPAIPVS
jgi:DNA recombination protein RmuC